MKRGIRTILLFAFLACAGTALGAAPELRLGEESHNFGEVYQGAAVRHTFGFENVGDAPLQIEKVRTSCGCTAALLSETQLAPGEKGELQASFDSARFRGPVVKTIYIYSNDPVRPVAQMYLRGRVEPEIAQNPLRLDLGPLVPEQEQIAEIRLTNQGKDEIDFPSIQVTAPELQAELSSDRLAPGETAVVTVRALPREGRNRINGYILIGTTSGNVPELRIPVYGTVTTQ